MSVIDDITLTKIEKDDKKIDEQAALPIYFEQIKNISDEDKKRIIDEILEELKEIRAERSEKRLDEKWDALDNQYEGKSDEEERQMFNLSRQVTRVKVNKVTNLIMQALTKPDPIFSVSPRPGFQKQGGQEVCDKQTDFLDGKLDYLPFRVPEGQTVHSAVLKGTGFLKTHHLIKREKRKREEIYKGTPKVVGMNQQTGEPIVENKGLAEFLRNWPDAIKDYPGYVKALAEGKEIRLVAEFTETTYNDPAYTSVDIKNFYARISCDGYEGLKTTKLIVEAIEYSYWDLKREEKREFFYDVDLLTFKGDDKDTKQQEKFKNKNYTILECTFYVKLKESDEEEIKCKFWISEERKKMIGSILWPYYGIDVEYIPHYISKKKKGLYGEGMGEVLTDSHIAENTILNSFLESFMIQNLITPIVEKNSGIHKQFVSKSWEHGIPLTKEKNETIDFLQKYMQPLRVGDGMALMQFLLQGDDDATGVSSLMSGRESPLDPTAPAAKTMELLKQSGINVEDYIISISPSFNTIGEHTLLIYYQIAQDGVEYTVSPDRQSEGNPFGVLSRAEMIAKTNIQVMATSFSFDKMEENRKDLALYTTFRQDPVVARNPEAVYFMAKQLIKSWSPKWKNLIENILPPIEQFKKEQMMVAVQAIAMYVKQVVAMAKATGQQPEIDPKQLIAVMAQAQQESVTPPPPEVLKERQKNAQPV